MNGYDRREQVADLRVGLLNQVQDFLLRVFPGGVRRADRHDARTDRRPDELRPAGRQVVPQSVMHAPGMRRDSPLADRTDHFTP